jgi:hypothetical protein
MVIPMMRFDDEDHNPREFAGVKMISRRGAKIFQRQRHEMNAKSTVRSNR